MKQQNNFTLNDLAEAAMYLIETHGTTTSLDVKNELRKRGFTAFQEDVAINLHNLAIDMNFNIDDENEYNVYSFYDYAGDTDCKCNCRCGDELNNEIHDDICIKNVKSGSMLLSDACIMADENDYIEVTEWQSEDGFDVSVCRGDGKQENYSFTYGEWEAISCILYKMLSDEE